MTKHLRLKDYIGPIAADATDGFIEINEDYDLLIAEAVASGYAVTVDMAPIKITAEIDSEIATLLKEHPYVKTKTEKALKAEEEKSSLEDKFAKMAKDIEKNKLARSQEVSDDVQMALDI